MTCYLKITIQLTNAQHFIDRYLTALYRQVPYITITCLQKADLVASTTRQDHLKILSTAEVYCIPCSCNQIPCNPQRTCIKIY